ncbi:hypothetical protein D9M71_611080 [compost metagenome]
MAHLEARRVVQLADLSRHRLADLAAAVAGVAAPQPGAAVEDLAAVDAAVVQALGALHQARARLELAVGGEGHPVVVQVAGAGDGRRWGVLAVHGATCAAGLADVAAGDVFDIVHGIAPY